MISVILLSCFTSIVSSVPVRPNVLPPLLSPGGATQAANQKLNAETPAPLSPEVGQPQPGVPQQPAPQGGPQFLPPTQYYVWSTLGGSPMIMPLQPSVHGSLPTLPQQPLTFPYRYVPLFSSPYRNQALSPYGFQMILAPPLQQTPANQPPNSLVLPAETPSGVAPSGNALNAPPQPIQQQQNPQFVYMLQQPMNAALGSLSSEELQMAATMGQLGVYLPRVLTNPSTGAVQPVNQATGLANPEQQGTVQTVNQAAGVTNTEQQGIVQTVNQAAGVTNTEQQGTVQTVNQAAGLANPDQQNIVPTVGAASAGVQQTPGPAGSGPQPNTNAIPVGMESPTQEVATVQIPVEPNLTPTQGNFV